MHLLASPARGPGTHYTPSGGTAENLELPGLPAPVPPTDKLMRYHAFSSVWLEPASYLLLSHPKLVASAVRIDGLSIMCSIHLKSNHLWMLMFYMALIKHRTLHECFIRD